MIITQILYEEYDPIYRITLANLYDVVKLVIIMSITIVLTALNLNLLTFYYTIAKSGTSKLKLDTPRIKLDITLAC
jgi:hypothetical protein